MPSHAKPVISRPRVLSDTSPLSTDQKAFNRLTQQIEKRRTLLAAWQETIPELQKKVLAEMYPLLARERQLKAELAERMDWAYDQKGITKTEKQKLSAFIMELALQTIDGDENQEAMKALYNRHSRSDFDAEENARMEQMKSMLEGAFGVDLGDAPDLSSPEAFFEQLQTHFNTMEEEAQVARKPRKKSVKQLEREARQEEEARQLSQSIRDLYRKLASVFHPDRETDPEERERKTALMQQANDAYERGNLLELLELQLQLEHIDPAHLANISTERLKHYIKILKNQVRELDTEIQQVHLRIASMFNIPLYPNSTPGGLMAQLGSDLAATKIQVHRLEKDIDTAGDLKTLKVWLKTVRLKSRAAVDFDLDPWF